MLTVKLPLAVMTAAFALTACVEPGEKTRQGAATGAAVGAVAGVVLGKGSRSDDIIKGAVVGGLIGGAIGNRLDAQERALRGSIGDSGALIVNTGSELIVTLPESITFETDSTYVRPSIQSTLTKLANNLNQYPDTTVDVIGHTDNVGAESYNQDLSARRAAAVSGILIRSGVSSNRIRAYGRGERDPIATNLTAEGRAQNRRVELVIIPN
jgi:outer membrane protein OmpA-like peptidoglycan-associated protein